MGQSTLKAIIKNCIRRVLYLFPVQRNKIVFLNFDGKGYGDNPKYIAEEILRQNLPWKMVWLTCDNSSVPRHIKTVRRGGFVAYYELSTSKYIVSNSKNNIPSYYLCRKKRNQFYLQTWHGDFALKFIEKETENTLSPDYIARSKIDSAATNAILSGNKYFSDILKESFWLPEHCKILELGVPRNDIYFAGEDLRNRLKQKLGFSLDDRILLYAPTFRDNYEFSCDLDFERLRRALCKFDGSTWKIIVRLHPNISSKADMICYNDDTINGSFYPDQQELCFISDCLITDFSSIMGDFLLMKKPVFLYATDLEEYADRITGRGLRSFYYELPFSLSHNQIELESHIMEFNEFGYYEKVGAFMQKYYCSFDDGHASERVVNYLKNILI